MPNSPTRRYARSLEPPDDETTLWVRGTSSAFPLVPKDRSSDSKALALTKTLHPPVAAVASGTRRFPLAYVLSTVALAVAGVALYFARTAPPESFRAAAAVPPRAVEIVAPAPPPFPVSPPASATRLIIVGKPPIDVMSLPIAPPASRARPRLASNPTARPPTPDPSASP